MRLPLHVSIVAVSIVALALVAIGCDDPDLGGETPRGERPSDPLAPGADPAPEPPSAAWPDHVDDLADAVARFTTTDACRAELAHRTPTAVAEGLDDLRYDAFFDDVCASLEAVRDDSVEACDRIGPSTTRAGCRRRIAIVHGHIDACPEDRVGGGHEPVCVAWAARDPALCRAAPVSERATCEAVLAGDPRGCERLRGGDRARCEAQVARYASALRGDREPRELVEPAMELDLDWGGGEREHIARDALDRGVRVRTNGCRYRVLLARSVGESRLGLTLAGARAGTFILELSVPAGASLPLRLDLGASDAVLSVLSPSRGELSSISGSTGHVELTAFEPELGGTITGTLQGSLRIGEARAQLRGRFTTFVRDADAIDPSCAPAHE
ncbi:MAG: hypothetical protein AB7S26_21790 [Sandaracinaceae bacterium]